MKKNVEVLFKDGNRTVNWEFSARTTVLKALKDREFEWEKDSVKINDVPTPDSMLDIALEHFVLVIPKHGLPRVNIRMKQVRKELPKKNPVQKAEVVEDVR